MPARGSRDARLRTEAERTRLHAARAAWHSRTIRRRRRDTVVATVAGSLIVVGAIASQVVHAQVTAPEPTPAPTSTSAPVETPSPAPSTSPPLSPTPTQSPGE